MLVWEQNKKKQMILFFSFTIQDVSAISGDGRSHHSSSRPPFERVPRITSNSKSANDQEPWYPMRGIPRSFWGSNAPLDLGTKIPPGPTPPDSALAGAACACARSCGWPKWSGSGVYRAGDQNWGWTGDRMNKGLLKNGIFPRNSAVTSAQRAGSPFVCWIKKCHLGWIWLHISWDIAVAWKILRRPQVMFSHRFRTLTRSWDDNQQKSIDSEKTLWMISGWWWATLGMLT